jgi:UDP-2,4-diacetamido-2,4,6-trideoxy-beta-L-altropyranose hydrolase
MPRFLFRIDVSPSTGTGHLRRCLTLAQELKEQGVEVFFACRLESFDIEKYMAHIASGWEEYDWSLTPEEDARKVVHSSKKYQADTVIIDHYRADEAYQNILYESGIKWLQFDGAARYPIWADWVLNMSPTASENLYEKLKTRKDTCLLLGPRYALLRREFKQWRFPAIKNRPVGRILLTFGGGDDRGATLFCLEAIQSLGEHVERVVLLSSSNPKKEEIVKWCKESRANIKIVMDAAETANYMATADLAITAGGMTVFEMAALGVPAMILQIADNQAPIARAWQQCGYGVDLGHLERLHPEDLQREIMSLMQDTARREAMSATGNAMVDGLGARRVAQALLFQEIDEME